MRILIVTQYFWPESFRINDVVLGLRALGHEVQVLTGKPNYPGGHFFPGYGFFGRSREAYAGARVMRVPLLPRGDGGGWRLLLNYLSFALLGSVLAPFRCRGPVDLLLVYEPSPITVGVPALVVKALKRVPLMFWVQDLWPESLSATGAVRCKPVLDAVAQLVRLIYRGCDRVLVQSRAFIDPVQAMGVARDRIRYLPNSAETLYRPMQPDAGPPVRRLPQGFRVMFAGNIGAAQSFDTILAAAEELRGEPEIHWVVLGDGRLHGWVQQEIARRRLAHCVHLLGRHPVESMPAWFAHADIMLVTLKKDPIFALTIPSKVQSYMACGRPIIAALEGEGARVVEEARAGVVVPPEDPSALARGVLKMYKMPRGERQLMGEQGRAYFLREFERDMLLARLDGWMRELVGGKAGCAS